MKPLKNEPFVKLNKTIVLLITFYVFGSLMTIRWGISGESRLYPYQMDEWHQLRSVKSVFQEGSPNFPGNAHGPLLPFFLAGLYLAPFVLFGVINPFLPQMDINTAVMLERIFIALRLNTLFWGLAAIFVLIKILRDYFQVNPAWGVFFFIFNPLWLSLSNYFKYDIALLFWLLLSTLAILAYLKNPAGQKYLLAGVICGLALATKISALPLIPVYSLVGYKKTGRITLPFKGLVAVLVTFLLCGVPYLFYDKSNLTAFLYSSLVSVPNQSGNFNVGMQPGLFLFFRHYPVLFGHVFWWGCVLAVAFGLFRKKKPPGVALVLLLFFLFFLSLTPLRLFVSNRALVLLPFMTLLFAVLAQNLALRFRPCALVLAVLLVIIQATETFGWWLVKFLPDPRQTASAWISRNLNTDKIGIENIPIYQLLPDKIVNAYYSGSRNYEIVSADSENLPPTVILTQTDFSQKYLKTAAKKDLLSRLTTEGYQVKAVFSPAKTLLHFFTDDLNFYLTNNIIPVSEIKIYSK